MSATTWWTIDRIRTANREAGQHFFEPGAMRFFRSRVLSGVYQGDGGVYFVTSERFVASDGSSPGRAFTVRQFNPETGSVSSVGAFNKLTRHMAAKTARKLADGETVCDANGVGFGVTK